MRQETDAARFEEKHYGAIGTAERWGVSADVVGWKAAQLSITPLALKILKPKTETDTLGGKREALLKPRIIKEFLTKYGDSATPHEDIALNVLKDLNVPKDRTKEVVAMIARNTGGCSTCRGPTNSHDENSRASACASCRIGGSKRLLPWPSFRG